jgi:tetratricopeptide (TPR) repeat protein
MYANAIPDLQAALEADPGDVELNALLGSSLQRLDKLDLAIDAYTKVLKKYSNYYSHQKLSQSLEKAPFVYENILARGNAYAQKKEYRKAR